MEVFNLPNTLTAVRIVLIPIFATAVIYGEHLLALYLFGAAAITDGLDGLAARLRNQRTPLGTFLDPLADKFLIATSFVLFSYYGWMPLWLTIAVISRDVIVTIGWVLLFMTTHTMRVHPSVLGKSAIATELVLLFYILINVGYEFLPQLRGFLIWTAAALTVLSCLHYIFWGLKGAEVTTGEIR